MRWSSFLLAFLLVVSSVAAEVDTGQTVSTEIDWSAGAVYVTVQRPVPTGGPNGPAAISRVRSEIEADREQIITARIRTLPWDSLRSIDELIHEQPHLITDIARVAAGATVADARATEDLTRVEVRFRFDLYGELLAALLPHNQALPLHGVLGWVPSIDYTGIVIYAADPLPVHGTGDETLLAPTLLPGIYVQTADGAGAELLMEAGNIDPAFVAQWGCVGYAGTVADAELTRRAGANPLTIAARGIFGRYPTDIVISETDAEQILARAQNRRLITEGRIMVVVDPQMLTLD